MFGHISVDNFSLSTTAFYEMGCQEKFFP